LDNAAEFPVTLSTAAKDPVIIHGTQPMIPELEQTLVRILRPTVLVLMAVAMLAGGCGSGARQGKPDKPIEQVLAEKKPDLMKIPGGEGVYYSKLPDGSPCLRIMVKERTPEVRTGIPNRIEGYPVVIENLTDIYGKPAGEGGM